MNYILRTIERFSNQLNYKKRDGAYNLGPLEGLEILDIGCGGASWLSLSRVLALSHGIDITSSAIKTAIFTREDDARNKLSMHEC